MELPRQLERKETGLVLMQVLCLVEYPLLRVMQPLLQAEGDDQSDQVAVLLWPGLTVFLTQLPAILTSGRLRSLSPTLMTDLVGATRRPFQGGPGPVVSPPARGPTLETVANVLQVHHGVVQVGLRGQHQQLALGVGVEVPVLAWIVAVHVVVLVPGLGGGLVSQAGQVQAGHVVPGARRPDCLALGASAGRHDVAIARARITSRVVAHPQIVPNFMGHHIYRSETRGGIGLLVTVPHAHLPYDAAVVLCTDAGDSGESHGEVTPLTRAVSRPEVDSGDQ